MCTPPAYDARHQHVAIMGVRNHTLSTHIYWLPVLAVACHRAAWGQASFSGCSPPEGIAKLVYVLLYDSLAILVQGALAIKHGRHLMIKRRRELATDSSKEELAAWTAKYRESCRLNELHVDIIEERQGYGKIKEETRHDVLICCWLASAL